MDRNQFNLLIVDDDQDLLTLLCRHLERNELLRVETESNPVTALERVRDGRYHMILMDIVMPEMDGLELLQAVKKEDPLLLVVMISSYATLGRVINSLSYGAYDFILKPLRDPDELDMIVSHSLQRIGHWRRILKETVRRDD